VTVGPEYRYRTRTSKAIAKSQISWIYLYSQELEKGKERIWLCKPCYDQGKSKTLRGSSTAGIGKHLNNIHGIYALGTDTSSSAGGSRTIDNYLEGVHPLQAER
jgi:hypothetical protein